jgi:3-methyladenine DNA glycosylase AlkD
MTNKTKDVLEKLKSLSNPKAVEGMARYGIKPEKALGVSIPLLRKMAKAIGCDHELAQELWATEVHEARILASMIDDPRLVDESQMERWVADFDSWDLCDHCLMNLFEDTGLAWAKAIEWSRREEEFIKRAGFVMMARLAVSDKAAEDGRFEKFFPMIKRGATDNRNFVKKAVNWALRQIGKRNLRLNQKSIELANEIQKLDSKSAAWIASDALQELEDQRVQKRLSLGMVTSDGGSEEVKE